MQRKHIRKMDAEEKEVIDGFDGGESYEQTLEKANYFFYDSKTSAPLIERKVM